MATLAELSVLITANLAPLRSAMQQADTEARKFGARFAAPFSAARLAVAGLGTSIAGLGLAAVGTDVIRTTAAFQKLQSSLTTVTGSAENGRRAFGMIVDFAAKTPYDLEQVTQAFIRLKALGLNPSEAALTSYGNVASAMSADLLQFVEAVADATTGEFERLKEFGITASSEGGKVAFTFQGVTTTVQKSAAAIEGFLQGIGNNQFGGAMSRQALTLAGSLSNADDAIKQFKFQIGRGGLADEVSAAARDLADFLGKNEELAHQIGGELAEALRSAIEVVKDFRTEAKGTFGGWLSREIQLTVDNFRDLVDELEGYSDRLRAVTQAQNEMGTVDYFLNGKPRVDALMEQYRREREQGRKAQEAARADRDRARADQIKADQAAEQSFVDASKPKQATAAVRELIGDLKAELDMIGQTTEARKVMENLRRAGAEAASEEGREIARLTMELERQTKVMRDRTRQSELAKEAFFDRAQLGRSEGERRIYSQFNSAELLDANGQISGAINQRIAEQMRWNQTIEETQEAFRGVGREIIDAGSLKGAGKAVAERFRKMFADSAGNAIDDSISTLISKAFPGAEGLQGLFGGKRDGTFCNPVMIQVTP